MRRTATLVAATGVFLVLVAPAAHAAVAVAGPGAASTGYATPIVVTPQGAPLTFVNGDIADHTVTAEATLPRRVARKTSYCKSYGVRSCPLFTSGVVPAGESGDVVGVNRAKPGREYEFSCQIHGSMTGTLVVAGAGATKP